MTIYVGGKPLALDPPVDNIYFVAAAGTAGAGGRSAADPTTLAEALKRLHRESWQRYGAIFVSGTVTWPGDTPLVIPGGRGGAFPFQFCSTWTPVDGGVQTATAIGGGTGVVQYTLTVSGASYVASAFKRCRVRFTGVAGGGTTVTNLRSVMVYDNTGTVITLVPPSGLSISGLPTFRVEQQAGTIDFLPGSGAAYIIAGSGSAVMFRGVTVTYASTLGFDDLRVLVDGATFEPRAGATSLSFFGNSNSRLLSAAANCGFVLRTSAHAADDLGTIDVTGGAWRGVAAASNNILAWSTASLSNPYLDDMALFQTSGGSLSLVAGAAKGKSGFDIRGGVARLSLTNVAYLSPAAQGSNAFFGRAYGGATCALNTVDITGLALTGDVLLFQDRAHAEMRAVTGTNASATGVAVKVRNGAELTTAGTTGNAITAATPTSDVQCGGNAAASSWAAVQSATGVNDLAAGTPQGCFAHGRS
jgi:hypothetical protein